MSVQVAAQTAAELGDVVPQRHQFGELLLEAGEVVGHLALRRLDDDGRRLRADALEVLERVRADPPVQLGVVHGVDDDGGRAERLHPVGRLAGTLQEEGDPPERARGVERGGQLVTFFFALFAVFLASLRAALACWAAFFCTRAVFFCALASCFSVASVALRPARRARQPTDGLPSVSTAASSSPPSRPRFLRKWMSCAVRSAPSFSQKRCPASVVGTMLPARAVAESRGSRPRANRAPAPTFTAASILTHCSTSLGPCTGSCLSAVSVSFSTTGRAPATRLCGLRRVSIPP